MASIVRMEVIASDKTTKVFYSPAYIAAACDFDTTRKSGWIADSLARWPIPGVQIVAPDLITIAQLEQVHVAEYVDAIRTGEPRDLAESNGLSWDPGLWTATRASSGGTVSAVLEALRTKRNSGSLSSGLHHAAVASGAGFCTFNGLALAAGEARNAGVRGVLILDLDAHCGGGTAAIVRDWPDVVQVDISVSRVDSYDPDLRARSTLDIVASAEAYIPSIQRRLRALDDLSFDVVISNAGMDPHQASLGGLRGITFDTLAQRERLVFDWARSRRLPVAFTLAGGYTDGGLSQEDLSRLHRLTIAAAALANRGEALEVHAITFASIVRLRPRPAE